MAEKRNVHDTFTEALTELNDITTMQYEKKRLEESLLHSVNELKKIFQEISDTSVQIDADKVSITEAIEMIDYLKTKKTEELAKVKKRNEADARKEELLFKAQNTEYKRKVAELEVIREECEHLQTVLVQKKARVADLQQQMDAETCLFVNQKVTLSDLSEDLRLQRDRAESVEKHKTIQSKSVNLDRNISATHADIEEIRKGNIALAKQLANVKSDNQLKSIELAALTSKATVDKVKYEAEREKQRKFLSEFRIADKQRQIELDGMKRQLAQQRAAYEHAQHVDADLTDRIANEFGNSKPLEEMMKEAKAERDRLQITWLGVTDKFDSITGSMTTNDIKLQELQEGKKKILQQLKWLNSAQQNVLTAAEERMDDSEDDFDGSEEEAKERNDEVVAQPMDESECGSSDSDDGILSGASWARRSHRVGVCSPDSSGWSPRSEEDANNSGNENQRRLKLFAERILFDL